MIPLARPLLEDDDIAAVVEALRSGQLVQGVRVAGFESACAALSGAKHAVAVSSGTAALHLALLAVGVSPGSRVAVPAFSWPATANVVELCGARPVFVDIDRESFAMSPEALRARLMQEDVDVVMPVHPFGAVADMGAILYEAKAAGARVVEDAACALGASRDGKQAGTWSAAGCFSFHPRKTVTTGEGGVVVTDDDDIARTVRTLRNHGLNPDAAVADFIEPGFNYRMTELQAALGETQLTKLGRVKQARAAQAAVYDSLLSNTTIGWQATPPGSQHAYQSYVALLPAPAAKKRARILELLRECGIEATIGTYHIPMTTTYRERYDFVVGDFPTTDDIAARAITLPMFVGLTRDDQQRVVAGLADSLAAVT